MNFNIAIYPYKPHSKSAELLAEAMDVPRIKHKNSKWKPGGRKLINWGFANPDTYPFNVMPKESILNHPLNVRRAINKLTFFKFLSEQAGVEYLPAWTDKIETAKSWIENKETVVCRTVLNGHEGAGIFFASTPEELIDAPLYTKYTKKKAEYRIHVIDGLVIDAQQKRRRRGHEGGDARLRNTVNGYVFCREGIHVPQCVKDVAVDCVKKLELDMGGVDVIYNEHYDKATVLEVNTAPGIEGTTVQKYKEALMNLLNAL